MPPRIGLSAAFGVRAVTRGPKPKTAPPSTFLVLSFTKANQPTVRHKRQTYATSADTNGKKFGSLRLPDDYVAPTQPPSAKPPESRKSQLLRTYTSLLRSTPLILIFQHNQIINQEWIAIRRELSVALRSVKAGPSDDALDMSATDYVRMQAIQKTMFRVATKMVEAYDPALAWKRGHRWTHDLGRAAMDATREAKLDEKSIFAHMKPLLEGPVALLTVPVVSPKHLATALGVLAPSKEFPAPSRRRRPFYYEPVVQAGLAKLMLIGSRIDDRVMDSEEVKRVSGIEGGIDAMRAKLVGILQSAGLGVTGALEGTGRSLWMALETRRGVLEEEEKGKKAVGGNE